MSLLDNYRMASNESKEYASMILEKSAGKEKETSA